MIENHAYKTFPLKCRNFWQETISFLLLVLIETLTVYFVALPGELVNRCSRALFSIAVFRSYFQSQIFLYVFNVYIVRFYPVF